MKGKHCIALIVAWLAFGSSALAIQIVEGGTETEAKYLLAMPDEWNGDLVVYAHGFIDHAKPIVLKGDGK
jgi:hypothetical protein